MNKCIMIAYAGVSRQGRGQGRLRYASKAALQPCPHVPHKQRHHLFGSGKSGRTVFKSPSARSRVINGFLCHLGRITASKSIALANMADHSAEQPLMRRDEEGEEEDIDLSDVDLLLEKNLRNPGLFVWLLTFSAGISGLLFGCKLKNSA